MKRILLIRFGSLGDVVLTTPVIRALRKTFPDAYIGMLVGDRYADIVSADPRLDEVIPFCREKKSPKEMQRIISLLKKKEFDIIIDLQRKFRSSLLAYLSGADTRIGKGIFSSIKIPDKENKHSVDRNLELLKPLGITEAERNPEIFLSDDDKEFADNYFKAKNLSSKHIVIGFFPGAAWLPRCWSTEKFAAIGDLAAEKYNAGIIIFGGPSESNIVDSVGKNMKNTAVLMKDKVKIRQLGAMIQKCQLFISNDTGPMHISVAVDTPTIGLFGPGNYIKFQPIGSKHIIVRHDLPCSPCKQFTNKCKDNICMKLITVDEVWGKANQMLSVIERSKYD